MFHGASGHAAELAAGTAVKLTRVAPMTASVMAEELAAIVLFHALLLLLQGYSACWALRLWLGGVCGAQPWLGPRGHVRAQEKSLTRHFASSGLLVRCLCRLGLSGICPRRNKRCLVGRTCPLDASRREAGSPARPRFRRRHPLQEVLMVVMSVAATKSRTPSLSWERSLLMLACFSFAPTFD